MRGGYDLNEPWPESLYREAVIVMNATVGYKVGQEEVDEEAKRRRAAMAKTGFVAGRDIAFWEKFIKDGVLDQARAISEGGLTAEQLPEKIEEMTELEWLTRADKRETAPLPRVRHGRPEEPASVRE